MSPPKDTKVNLILNFWGRAECTRKRNKFLLQVGLKPWTFRSAVQHFNQERPPSTHIGVWFASYKKKKSKAWARNEAQTCQKYFLGPESDRFMMSPLHKEWAWEWQTSCIGSRMRPWTPLHNGAIKLLGPEWGHKRPIRSASDSGFRTSAMIK